MPDAVYSWT